MVDKSKDASYRTQNSNLISYDAIVALDGSGDYDSIKQALDSGKKNIFVRKGTYDLNADLVIESDTSITGEDKYNTIINMNVNNYVSIVGTNQYSTGTINYVSGTTVYGTGTSWLTRVFAGYHIIINNIPYEVASVTSNTQLEIVETYGGYTTSTSFLGTYIVANFRNNINISNFTMINSDESYVLRILYTINSTFNNIIISHNGIITTGIDMSYSFCNTISNIDASKNGGYGIELISSNNNSIFNVNVSNNTYSGIYVSYSNQNNINNVVINNCILAALELSNSNYNIISGISITCSRSIRLTSSHRNNISNCNLYKVISNDGIDLNSSNYNAITGNSINVAHYDGIDLNDSHYNVINGNTIHDGYQRGIELNSANYNAISGNTFYKNTMELVSAGEISLSGSSNHNNIVGNTFVGRGAAYSYSIIQEESGSTCNYNLASSNILSGYTASGISFIGANSISVHNIL